MPKKFIKCVKEVSRNIKKSGYKGNPYAICRVSTGYYGSTRDIGMIHKKTDGNIKNKIMRFK